MHSKKLLIAAIIFLGLTFTAFQCSSTELTSAKLYIQQKRFDKALELLQKEVQKNPQSAEGYYLLGVVHGEQKNYEEMLDAYEKSLSISDEFRQNIQDSKQYYWATLFNQGVGFYQKGNKSENEDSTKVYYEKSMNAFEKAIEIEPDSATTYQNLSFVYISAQEYDKAIPVLESSIEKEPSLDAYKFLGEILYDKGNRLMSKFRETGNVQDSVQAMEIYNKAVSVLEKGREFYPEDPDILLTLSNAYIAANKIDVARKAFEAGVKQEPENQYYRYNYGVLLLGANEYSKAEEQFKKAIEIDPNYENAIYNIAVTYVRWGTEMREEAEENEDDSQEYKEKYQQALPYLETVVEVRSEDASVWELLGKVYAILGMQDDAENAFNKADQLRQ